MEKIKQNNMRYERSFLAKVIQGEDLVKEFYCKIKTHLLSFKDVKVRETMKASTFRLHGKVLAKLTLRGKTLTLHLPLDVNNYVDSKFRVYDMGDKKSYANVPLAYKVRSIRALNNALKLLDDVLNPLDLKHVRALRTFNKEDYPYKTDGELLALGLIKIRTTKAAKEEVAVHESVSVEEAHVEISDEIALDHVVIGHVRKENNEKGKKVIVNIDTLSASFNNNELVNLNTLKEKGLVPKNAGHVKVLARGVLNKSLIVEADAYSLDAIKMILLTGGTVIENE